jgi:hypothetical protein
MAEAPHGAGPIQESSHSGAIGAGSGNCAAAAAHATAVWGRVRCCATVSLKVHPAAQHAACMHANTMCCPDDHAMMPVNFTSAHRAKSKLAVQGSLRCWKPCSSTRHYDLWATGYAADPVGRTHLLDTRTPQAVAPRGRPEEAPSHPGGKCNRC